MRGAPNKIPENIAQGYIVGKNVIEALIRRADTEFNSNDVDEINAELKQIWKTYGECTTKPKKNVN